MNQNNSKQCKWLDHCNMKSVPLQLMQSKHCCFCWMQGSFAGTNYHGGQVGRWSLTSTQIPSSGINMAQLSYLPEAIKYWVQFSHRDRYNNSRECMGLLFSHSWHFSYILLQTGAKVSLWVIETFLP